MRSSLILIFLLNFVFFGYSQNYFQQDVSYYINAELNDESHQLEGSYKLNYTNNSPDVLNEIYIHLWPNAFKDKSSFYSQDELRIGRRKFYFAKETALGGFEELNFLIEGSAPIIEYVDNYEDIAKIVLTKPLLPSESLELEATFILKVPHFFSRLGRTRDTYHFMHWYPRVAVYDATGWHPYHYGAIGEFYGEYGNYEVVLKVPSELRIGFTGKGTAAIPSSNNDGTMTWTISAKQVHDFAWVAGKNYITDFEKVKSIDGRDISLTILRRQGERLHWKNAMQYLKESFAFYEKNVGAYAYDEVVLVQGTIKGHGNMEYPGMIVVTDRGNDKSLDYYINHELGHQWFYGALGFNERKEPWLDEGLTTFYEHRYTLSKHGKLHYDDEADGLFKKGEDITLSHAVVQQQINTRFSQRADTPIDKLSAINYGIRSYEQAAASYLYLEEYLGKSDFDRIMKSFYAAWKFKHPSTVDVQAHFEKESYRKLDWFFKEVLVGNKKVDYKLSNVIDNGNTYTVTINNVGELAMPVVIDGYKDDKRVLSQWLDVVEDSKTVTIDKADLDRISIDGENLLFDVNRENNHSTGFFSNLKISLPNRLNGSAERNLFVLPVIGFNTADGLYAGLGWTNSSFPSKRFQIRGLSTYAFDSKEIVGGGEVNYSFYPDESKFRKIQIGVSRRSYHYKVLTTRPEVGNQYARYDKFQPYAKFFMNNNMSSRTQSWFTLRSIWIRQEEFDFEQIDSMTVYAGKSSDSYLTSLLSFNRNNYSALYPSQLELEAEFSAYTNVVEESHNYLKLSMTYNQGFYFAKNKIVDLRLFAGWFALNSQRESSSFNGALNRGFLSLFNEGHNDILFEQPFLDRNGNGAATVANNQITIREGGFRNAIGSASRKGYSNDYLMALNLKTDLPINLPTFLPIKIFGDVAMVNTKSVSSDPLERQLFYSAGIMLDFKAVQINLPMVYSEDIEIAYGSERSRFYNRITIAINLEDFLIWDMIDNKRF